MQEKPLLPDVILATALTADFALNEASQNLRNTIEISTKTLLATVAADPDLTDAHVDGYAGFLARLFMLLAAGALVAHISDTAAANAMQTVGGVH